MNAKFDAILGEVRESDVVPGEGNVAIEAGENVTFGLNPSNGATIINAAGGGSMGQTYTVNGQQPDENGNFEIDLEGLGGAPVIHTHVIGDVTGLTEALAGKSPTNHTHNYVTGLVAQGTTLAGNVAITGGNNVTVSRVGNAAQIDFDLAAANAAAVMRSLVDANGDAIRVFIGTTAQWMALTKAANEQYLVCLLDDGGAV